VGRLPKVARPRNLGLNASIPLGLGNGFWRDAENGHRDGRAPRQCPNWWPCASTGQWRFGVDERGKGRLNLPMNDSDENFTEDRLALEILRKRTRYAGHWEALKKQDKEIIVVFDLLAAIHQREKRRWIKRIEPGLKSNEPPDVVGINQENKRVAFEVTELVEPSAIKSHKKVKPIRVDWNSDEILKRLQSKIDGKGLRCFSKEYESVVLVIHTAERHLRPDKFSPVIAAHRFVRRGQINEVYLIFPSKTPPLFHDREHGICPYLRLSFE
jgi:hypothetical protein